MAWYCISVPRHCNVRKEQLDYSWNNLKTKNVDGQRISTGQSVWRPSPLLCVRVVCRDGAEALQLPHVVETLSAFLDWSPKWTLARACNINSLRLVRRLLQQPADNIWRSNGLGDDEFPERIVSRKESKHGGELE
ncbi:hypothetical protein GQ600_20252 [Phytophthora cactorum]|nr:hypothetical protein GQ600_20252 [Phytophthora cactorum]